MCDGRRLAFQIGDGMSEQPPSEAHDVLPAHKREALELFRGLPRRYDLLSSALSFWPGPALAPRARRSARAGTGRARARRGDGHGDGRRRAARALPDCTVVGLDQSAEMLARRPRALRRRRSRRAGRGSGRAAARSPTASFDALTFTYLLRYVEDPAATLRELARVVKPGGRVASLEFGVPPWLPARWAWRLYTAVGLPVLGRLSSREWAEVGRFLGPSIRGYYERHPVERIVGYWQAAGLSEVRVRRMSLGGGIVTSAVKAAGPGDARGA